jgi:hypothetical protein
MSEDFEKDLIEDFGKEKTKEEREAEEKRETKQVVDRIIRGVNDTFEKDYTFEDLDMKFKIKIKAPNALEIGKIQARMSAYLGGMNNYASEYMIVVYQTLATLRVTGVNVPKELENDEDIYNLEILYTIGRDFQKWLNNFRF